MKKLATSLALVTFCPAAAVFGQSSFTNLFRSGDVLPSGRTVEGPRQLAGNATGSGYAVSLAMTDGSGEIWFDFVDDGTTQPQFGWATPVGSFYIDFSGLRASAGSIAWSNRSDAAGGTQGQVLKDGIIVAETGGPGPLAGSSWVEAVRSIGLTPAGEVIVAGTLDVPTGPDQAVIANVTSGQVMLRTGDVVQGASGTIDSFRLATTSPDGSQLLVSAFMSSGQEWLVLDGAVVSLGTTPVRVGATIPQGFGAASGETISLIWGADVSNDGQWIADLGYNGLNNDAVVRNGALVDVPFGPWPGSVGLGARGYALVSDGYSLLGDAAMIASDDSPVDQDRDGVIDAGWKIVEPILDTGGSGFSNPSFCYASSNGNGVVYLQTRLTGPGYDGQTIGRLDTALHGNGFCLSEENSTGARGRATLLGSAIVGDDDLAIIVHQLPPSVTGLGICSLTQGFTPQAGGSTGTLCLGGSIGRLMSGIFSSGSEGAARISLPLSAMPQPNGVVQVMAGQQWNFQAWHRDTVNGVATSNFTDAVTLQFL